MDSASGIGGSGGLGVSSSITGTSVCRAGGGGGWGATVLGNALCGGGKAIIAPNNALPNSGGGGGARGNGGSGVVIIKYKTADFGTCTGGTKTTSGEYTIHSFNSSGIFTVVAKTIQQQNQIPTITLNGDNPTTILVGETFVDAGYTATDAEDGNITSSVVVSGTVDTNTVGIYTLNYNVTDSNGNTATQLTRTIIVEQPVESSSKIQYIHTDHLGGTNVVTNESGEVIQLLDYYPYGKIWVDEKSSSFSEQKKFIGQEYDEDTELSYLNARYYNGENGKFLSLDPVFWEVGQTKDGKSALLNPQAMNSYSYAGNNPITYSDPDGKFVQALIPVVIFAPQIISYTQSLLTPIGQYAVTQAFQDASAGNYGMAFLGALTAGESSVGVKTAQELTPNLQHVLQDIKSVGVAYSRPSGMTTNAQRMAVNAEGSICVNCGKTGVKMFADHKTPLSVEYYTTGKIDTQNARSLNAVQPQCQSCSAKQGGILSAFSKTVILY